MKFGMKDLRTVNSALVRAIEWEESLAEANKHIPVERKKCERRLEVYRRLRMKVFAKLNLNLPADPFEGAKSVTMDELRSQESGESRKA